QRVVLTRDFRRMAFLCCRGQHNLRVSQARATGKETLPNGGLSACPCLVHRDGGRSALLHVRQQLERFDCWPGRHPARRAGLLVLRLAARSHTPMTVLRNTRQNSGASSIVPAKFSAAEL